MQDSVVRRNRSCFSRGAAAQLGTITVLCVAVSCSCAVQAEIVYQVDHSFAATNGSGVVRIHGTIQVLNENPSITDPEAVTDFSLTWTNPGGSELPVTLEKNDSQGSDLFMSGQAFIEATASSLIFHVGQADLLSSEFNTIGISDSDGASLSPNNPSAGFVIRSVDAITHTIDEVEANLFDGVVDFSAVSSVTGRPASFLFGDVTAVPEASTTWLLCWLFGIGAGWKRRSRGD